MGIGTRSGLKKAIRAGAVFVNGGMPWNIT